MRQACSAHRSRRRARRCSRPPSCTGTARPPHGRAARSRAPRPSCPPLGCRRAARTALTPPSALSAGAQNPGTALCVRVHGPPPTWARQRRLRGSTRDAPRFDLLRVRAVNPHPNAGQTCARAQAINNLGAAKAPGPAPQLVEFGVNSHPSAHKEDGSWCGPVATPGALGITTSVGVP